MGDDDARGRRGERGKRERKTARARTPMSNHPSVAWRAARVALGVLFWEGQFQISKQCFAKRLPETSEKERTYKRAVSSYIVSFVHAFFLTWAGWRIVFKLRLGSVAERLSLYANADASFVGFVEVVTIAFFSYVVYDLLHVIEQYPDLGGVDILAHHLGFFTTSWREMEYTLPNIDALAKFFGMKTRGVVAGNWLEYYVSVAFLWVFVAVRVVGYGGALIALTFDLT